MERQKDADFQLNLWEFKYLSVLCVQCWDWLSSIHSVHENLDEHATEIMRIVLL